MKIKKPHKKLLKKHKMVLEMIKNECDLYEIFDRFEATEEDIKFWRKTILEFDEEYLKAIGLTRVQEQFIDLFPKKLLNVSATCRTVGISRQTFYRWRENSDTFSVFMYNIVEGFKDDVETILYKKVLIEQDFKALCFLAEAKMKDRGYGVTYITPIETTRSIQSLGKDYDSLSIKELNAEIALLEEKLN